MAHKLEGSWRSFLLKRGDTAPPAAPLIWDNIVTITTIDPTTGKIVLGDHVTKPISGQVTELGTLHVVIEHQELNSTTTTRRYEGLLVVDNAPTRLVIIVKKTTHPSILPISADARQEKAEQDGGVKVKDGQDDGTWVMTKP